MKIGTMLNLELRKAGIKEPIKYHCKVVEKNENYLFIDYPIEMKSKKTAFIPKGTILEVTYKGDDQTIYYFRTEIVSKLKLTVPALAITFSDETEIKRIQRREFVRVETSADVAIHSSDDTFSPFVTVTTDISGGGMSIIIPKDKTLETNIFVDAWLTIQITGEHHYINAEAEVVSIKTLNNSINTASLKFMSLPKQPQQAIIRYCFEKQREARKKELL